MNEREVFFNFQGVRVKVRSSFNEVLDKLESDFYTFQASEISETDIFLEIEKDTVTVQSEIIWDRVSRKVRYYQEGSERISFYEGKVKTLINFDTDRAKIFGLDENLVHEIAYLLVLTRVGKKLDIKRLHRIHAFGITINETLVLGLFPSGSGKTTILSHFLAKEIGGVISDDSPLVDSQGEVHSFLVRLGFEEKGVVPDEWKNKPFYFLERRHFGLKKLLSFRDITYKENEKHQRVILLRVSKKRGEKVSIREEFGFFHLKHLFKEGVVGFGLPMLFEYFWEPGWKDFLRKTAIFFSRLGATLRLWLKAKSYKVVLTNNPAINVELLSKEIEKL